MLYDNLFDKEMDQDEFDGMIWQIIDNLEETCDKYADEYDLKFNGLREYVD